MTEYEIVRRKAEDDAIQCGAMNDAAINHARRTGVNLTAMCGLTPARVWDMTRHMRRAENGGVR